MKILIFSLAYHPFVGGAEVAIKEITDRLGGDFEFDLITANLDGRQKSEEQIGRVKVHRLCYVASYVTKYLFPWLAFKKAAELQAQNHYDAVWAMMANQAGWAALKFKKKFPAVKYLLSLQEGDSEWDIWRRTFFIRPIYKAIYRRADYIQAISNFLAKRAKKLGARCPIEVVPNGIQVESQKSKVESIGDKKIITVSRLVKKNGISDLIKAMTAVEGELLILGDGKLRKILERLTERLGIKNKVKSLGYLSQDEVYKYLSQADVFVRSSLSEGLGNSFLEAMAMRVPVIGTPVGGIPDFLKDGETGWFCQVKNPKSISGKINYILDGKNKAEVARIVAAANAMVMEKYNWALVTSKMKNIFQILISKNNL